MSLFDVSGADATLHGLIHADYPVPLTLAQRAADPDAARQEVLRSVVNARSRTRMPGTDSRASIVSPGSPQHSALAVRMQSRNPALADAAAGHQHSRSRRPGADPALDRH
jgi:hypothetical protein